MNRFEYLGALNNCIQHELPADEYNNVMQYYSEYFADAGIEKEQEVIQELGAVGTCQTYHCRVPRQTAGRG